MIVTGVDAALAPILHGFWWLGLDWDEGPEAGAGQLEQGAEADRAPGQAREDGGPGGEAGVAAPEPDHGRRQRAHRYATDTDEIDFFIHTLFSGKNVLTNLNW